MMRASVPTVFDGTGNWPSAEAFERIPNRNFVAACQVSALQSVVSNSFSIFINSRATRGKS